MTARLYDLFLATRSKLSCMPCPGHIRSITYPGLVGEEEPRDQREPGTQQFGGVSRDRGAHERQESAKYGDEARERRWRFLDQLTQAQIQCQYVHPG